MEKKSYDAELRTLERRRLERLERLARELELALRQEDDRLAAQAGALRAALAQRCNALLPQGVC